MWVIDAYAVRTFNLSVDMHLMPVTDTNTDDWEGGVCIARCKDLTVTHGPVPDDGCHCGIHAAKTMDTLSGMGS